MKPTNELGAFSSTEKTSGLASTTSGYSTTSRLTNAHSSGTVYPSRLVNMCVHNADLKETTSTPIQEPESINTKMLEVSIAADYTAASIEATKSSLPSDSVDNQNELSLAIRQYRGASSIDEVAQAAADAIASIRNATDPEDIAEQLTSLKKFSDQIKSSSSIPEIQGLSDTLEKFISVVSKSTGVKLLEEKAAATVKVVTKPKLTTTRTTKTTARPKIVTGHTVTHSTSKAHTTTAKRPVVTRRSSTHDDAALRKALHSVATMDDEKSTTRKNKRTKRETKSYVKAPRKQRHTGKRFILALGCAAACVAAIIYCVGTNVPDISVRVAAMQTGVEASYPSYIPRDFSLEGINSENGKITLSFVGPENAKFTLIEEKSSWDSTALLRNYVEPTWHESYTTTHEQGITIYISGSNAAWVNGGVLYKINSANNTLTKKQLRNIVTSM